MKKMFSLFLVFALSISILGTHAFAKAESDVITPYYTNATVARVVLTIDDTGLATIKSTCTGISSTTSISAITYLEKSVNGSWVRVDISETNDQWVTSTNIRIYSVTKTHQLSSNGTYRAVTVFTVTAGSAETITVISEATY